jgi:hypothetical protein
VVPIATWLKGTSRESSVEPRHVDDEAQAEGGECGRDMRAQQRFLPIIAFGDRLRHVAEGDREAPKIATLDIHKIALLAQYKKG